jgi:LDH2 family malate/lactate/ureidoglycolate dehydrogenase
MALQTIEVSRLHQWISMLLSRAGVTEADAQLIAAVRSEAALRDPLGFDTFAAHSLAHVVERLRRGGLNPRPNIRVLHEDASLAILDGDGAIGQLVGVHAMEHCLRLVDRHGLALVGVRHSSSLGALAYYAMMAVPRQYIGLAATNTELRIGMPPWGGVTPTLGNNPFAVAIPAGEDRPIVVDMSLTATEPQGIGHGTMAHRQALLASGSVVRPVMGGHKGYALAVVLEIVCGVLTGAGFGLAHAHERIGTPATTPDLGHLLAAVDVKRLMPSPLFQARLSTLIQQIQASERAQGVERILLPGELEFDRRDARLHSGIPVEEEAIATLHTVAESLGLQLKA